MSTDSPPPSVADGGVTDTGGDHSDLVGNTMLSTWDIVTVIIYFILVMGTGIYVSRRILLV